MKKKTYFAIFRLDKEGRQTLVSTCVSEGYAMDIVKRMRNAESDPQATIWYEKL